MKKTIVAGAVLFALFNASLAFAWSSLLETEDEARMRHEQEAYEQQQDNWISRQYGQPLGGYSTDRLGDTAPEGTRYPDGSRKGYGGRIIR